MLVQYGALRYRLSQSRGRSNVPFGSGDRRRFLAAEQSGISAARHIFRLQGVFCTPATLGDQDIDFTGGGTLALREPARFYGEISNFGSGDTIKLEDLWRFSAISGEIGGVTTLTLHRGSAAHDFEFVGDYTRSDFSITPGKITKITHA